MRFKINRLQSLLLAGTAALALATGSIPLRAQNAATAMQSDPNLTRWTHIVGVAGLMQGAATNAVTVFAITNEGFEKANAVWRNALRSPGAGGSPKFQKMQNFVRSQAVFGLHPMSEFAGKTVTLTSIAGTPITIDATNPAMITVTMAYVTATMSGRAITTSQAVIYPVIIDKVHS